MPDFHYISISHLRVGNLPIQACFTRQHQHLQADVVVVANFEVTCRPEGMAFKNTKDAGEVSKGIGMVQDHLLGTWNSAERELLCLVWDPGESVGQPSPNQSESPVPIEAVLKPLQ